mmetsp:Transcript_6493/g.16110  ORF Transcript_6493/g.16110 Transcript_6493/m.16110 type:complete len:91 (+) Transcript_6493:830-1102(+)
MCTKKLSFRGVERLGTTTRYSRHVYRSRGPYFHVGVEFRTFCKIRGGDTKSSCLRGLGGHTVRSAVEMPYVLIPPALEILQLEVEMDEKL